MRRRSELFGCCLALLLAVGCSGKPREAAQHATEKFRARWLKGAFAEIYDASEPPFRASLTQEQAINWMTAVSSRLGKWQSAEPGAWSINDGSDGKTVMLAYQSKFENGTADETFAWRMKEKEPEPALVGYHINSPLIRLDDLRTK
jgi:hypothetical protein